MAVALDVSPVYEDGAKPRIVVQQISTYRRDSSGALSGTVRLFMVRSDLHRPMRGTDVLDKLEALGWNFPVRHDEAALTESCQGGEVDSFDLTIGQGWPSVPLLADDVDVSPVSGQVASMIRPDYVDRIRRLGGTPRVDVHADGPARLISDEATDGQRVIVTESAFTLAHSNLDTSDAIRDVDTCAAMFVDRYTRAGRVTAAEIVTAGPYTADGNHVGGLGVLLRLTTISQAA